MNVEAAAESPVILMLQPQSGLGQQVKASQITVRPDIPLRDFKDLSETSPSARRPSRGALGHHQHLHRGEPDEIAVNPDAGFTLVQNLPEDALPYLLPSRYCESDKFLKMATSIAHKAKPGYQQA